MDLVVFDDFIDCVDDSPKNDEMKEDALAGSENPNEQMFDN